jgi:hypothetical protein
LELVTKVIAQNASRDHIRRGKEWVIAPCAWLESIRPVWGWTMKAAASGATLERFRQAQALQVK